MNRDVGKYLITENLSIKDAMKRMSETGQKSLFVVGKDAELKGSLSDGDIRRALLKGSTLSSEIRSIYNRSPISVKEGFDTKNVKRTMLRTLIECIPVIDRSGKVIDILTWGDMFSDKQKAVKQKIDIDAVIMAGGKGTRLDPFTRILPKPLIPIGDKPILEIIMDKLAESGVKKFSITVNHKAKMIKSYFDEAGSKYPIEYIEENKPLGTAGSLRLLKGLTSPFLVTNCDIIIDTDYGKILEYHRANKNDITIVASCKNFIIPYGVCEFGDGGVLTGMSEKPGYDLFVNTGMYVVDKKVLKIIPKGKYFDFTELIERSRERSMRIGVFPIGEDSWIDIGQWEEYHKAIEKMKI